MTQAPDEGHVPAEPPTGRRGGGRGGATPSRVGSLWVASILFALVLLLLLIFVLQNGQDAKISYLGAHGSLPQGVALLLAAVFGILLVALPGTARIIQLRIRDRRHRGAGSTDAGPTDAGPSGTQPTRMPQHDVTSPTTTAPTTPVASPTAPTTPAQPPPADAR